MQKRWFPVAYAEIGKKDKNFILLVPVRGGDGRPLAEDLKETAQVALVLDAIYPVTKNALVN